MIKRINSTLRWFVFPLVLAGIIALSFLYFLLWKQLIGNNKLRTTTDFAAFYAAGWIAKNNGASQVYDLTLQKEVEERISGTSILLDEVNPFVHPPFVIPLVYLIAQTDYVASYQNWALMMSALLVGSAFILILSLTEISKKDAFLLFIVSLLFFPGMVSILNGQDSAILLFGGGIWLYGLVKGKYQLAGVGLALTTIRPQISIILALPFLFKLRKVWWWYCLGVLCLFIISLVVMGPGHLISFLRVLTVSASGEGYLINEQAMVNLLGLLRHIFSGVSPTILRSISWFSFILAVGAVVLLWTRGKFAIENYIVFSVIISIFFSPHLHYHDLVLLLLPLFGIIRLLLQRGMISSKSIALGLLVISILMLVNHLSPLGHIIPYLIMVLSVLGIMLIGKTNPGSITIDNIFSTS